MEQYSTNDKNHQEVRMTHGGGYEIEKRLSFFDGTFFIFHLRQFEATVSWRSCTQLWRFKNTIFTYDR